MNKIKLFDIAANLTDDQFNGRYHHHVHHESDVKDVIKRAQDIGCQHLLIASGCLSDLTKAIPLCALSPHFYTTAGIHPCRAADLSKGDPYKYLAKLREQMEIAHKQKKLLLIGECGLDYDRLEWSTKQEQFLAFEHHFSWADEFKLPLYLHNRNTGNDFYDLLQIHKHKLHGGVVHSFTGPKDELQKALSFGFYIGVNGCSLKTQENIEVAKQIPLDKLLLETDSPYCEIRNTHASSKLVKTQFQAQKSEKWKQGYLVKGRNEPCKIIQVLEVMSELHKMDMAELADIVFKNTLKCFNLNE